MINGRVVSGEIGFRDATGRPAHDNLADELLLLFALQAGFRFLEVIALTARNGAAEIAAMFAVRMTANSAPSRRGETSLRSSSAHDLGSADKRIQGAQHMTASFWRSDRQGRRLA